MPDQAHTRHDRAGRCRQVQLPRTSAFFSRFGSLFCFDLLPLSGREIVIVFHPLPKPIGLRILQNSITEDQQRAQAGYSKHNGTGDNCGGDAG